MNFVLHGSSVASGITIGQAHLVSSARLDVIGEYLTEVNVTSPTCMREIQDQTGFDAADLFLQALEQKVRS